jgi:hypothetical protein
VLLNVRRDSIIDPELFTGVVSNLDQRAVALALSSIASELSVPVVAEVGHGRVAYAVADAVSRHHPTLVVLGRPDTEDTPDELVNTTALDMLRTAPYPMLVVPHSVHTTATPRRVLLAVNGEEFSLGKHAGAMRHLLDALHAELTVLHVSDNPSQSENDAALAMVQRTGLTADLERPT